MKKNNSVLSIFTAALFSSVLIISCNQSDIGIFYGIETEEKIIDGSLSNSLTIGAMDKLGTELFIAAGKVYTKTSGSSEDWDKCSSPSGYDLCTSMTSFNGNLYAVWFDMNNADTALFSSPDGNSWSQVTDSGFSGEFSLVKSANNAVMVVSTVTDTNEGYYYTTTTGNNNDFDIIQYSGSDINALGGHFDMDFDGTNYWFLTKENIYIDNGADFTDLDSVSQNKVDDDEYFRYIYAYDETHVYTNRSYGEFSFYNGSSWDNSVENLVVNVNDMTVFTVNAVPTFFVGTYSLGYYEPDSPGLDISDLDNPESDSITCDYSTYNASDLRFAAVLGFFADGDELYALTYGERTLEKYR